LKIAGYTFYHPNLVIRQPTSQNVIVLGLVIGGCALLLSQMSPYLNLFLIMAIFAAALGFLWPEKVWQWGFWLSLPLLILTLVNFTQAPNINALAYRILHFAGVLISAYLGCLVGARFSPRRVGLRGNR
jgi:hypothetical protein